MSPHLIPFAFGAAVGSVAVVVWKDEQLRKRLTDESAQLTDKVNAYVAGLMHSGAQTIADAPILAETQQQPIHQPSPEPAADAGLSSGSDAEPSPSTWGALKPSTATEPEPELDQEPVRLAESEPAAAANVQPADEPAPAASQAEPEPAVQADMQPAAEPVADLVAEPVSDQAAPPTASQPAIQPDPEPAPKAQPTREADQHRCEAKTKIGDRCRAKTYAIVSMPWGDLESADVGLCWRHAKIHEEGGTVPLIKKKKKKKG